MALRKQTVTHNGVLSKIKTNSTAWDMVPSPTVDQQPAVEDTGFSPQGQPLTFD